MHFIFRGFDVVPDSEVIEMYQGSHVPLEQMSDFYGKVKLINVSLDSFLRYIRSLTLLNFDMDVTNAKIAAVIINVIDCSVLP